MARRLSAVASSVNGRLVGADAEFNAVSTDTRKLVPGSLFVAIRGERFDGNDYVSAAAAQGAVGALVSRSVTAPLGQIEVADTRLAFGAMARAWRGNFAIPVVAVTGSAGKTTVKELIAAILGASRRVCVTEGNLNNDIGVPLILMRLDATHEALVIELGANHAGEIANLGGIVRPTISVITNAGPAHLEGFGSLEGVARAKGELIDSLPADGVAILNADDRFFPEWRRRAGARRVVSFGFGAAADVRLTGEPAVSGAGSDFTIAMPDGRRIDVRLPLLGRANVGNALAAAAAASAAGASDDDIRRGLARARAVKGRLHPLPGRRGATLIDDSYNANPSAARAALDFLSGCGGERIFVLGNMLELGAEAASLHKAVGEYARGRCDRMITVGDLAAEAARAFGKNALPFATLEAAAPGLLERLGPTVTVLVKASRSMGLDRLVALLAESPEGGTC
jgi:UDP-N-acetylmuramoyl-tripeptide--D-alanyl-D-alanine ligase